MREFTIHFLPGFSMWPHVICSIHGLGTFPFLASSANTMPYIKNLDDKAAECTIYIHTQHTQKPVFRVCHPRDCLFGNTLLNIKD